MKKTLSIIAALVLALGMTQCKKAEKPQASTGDPIHVTFTATYGGERTSFNPAGGSFTWNTSGTEYIYVGCEGIDGCIGELTATATGGTSLTFEGTLTQTPTSGATLHFFYLGNGRHQNATTLDFSSQNGTLANLTNYHIAVGSQKYNGSDNFSAYLEPLVAFAYFDLSGFGNEAVSISGDDVYSTATIDYKTGKIIAGNTKGSISVGTPLNGGNYVALIPSTNSETDLEFENSSKTGTFTFLRGIVTGRYYANSDNSALAVTAEAAPEGYVFSVDQNTTVKFSPGNLQYRPSDGAWQFAAHQYEYIGSSNSSVPSSYTGWIDLFAFGTGDDPLNGSDGYYTSGSNDWGGYCGDPTGNNYTWRTLTIDEWEYLLTNSATRGDYPYLKANIVVNNTTYNGLILFPDNYGGSGLTGSYTYNNANSNYTSVSAEDWELMEAAGAVFFPAAGWRNVTGNPKTGYTVTYQDFGETGCYWSSTTAYSEQYSICFTTSILYSSIPDDGKLGYSVRLVRIL